jgi:hypothetical protein
VLPSTFAASQWTDPSESCFDYSDAGVVALTFYFWKNRMPRMPNYLAALAASEHKEDLK